MVWFISDFPISPQDGEGNAKLWIFVVYALLSRNFNVAIYVLFLPNSYELKSSDRQPSRFLDVWHHIIISSQIQSEQKTLHVLYFLKICWLKDINYNHHIITNTKCTAFFYMSLHFSAFICISLAILCISLHFFVYL